MFSQAAGAQRVDTESQTHRLIAEREVAEAQGVSVDEVRLDPEA